MLITKTSAAVCEPIECLPVKAIGYLTGAFRRGRDSSRPEVFDAFLYIPSAAACQSTLVAAGSRACPPAICLGLLVQDVDLQPRQLVSPAICVDNRSRGISDC